MSKTKKSRKHKKYTPKTAQQRPVKQYLPAGHRFDDEIADLCSTILLRVQMRKLEKPVAIERELRKEIKADIAKGKMSHVANNFFASIIAIGDENPFVRSATRLLNATYKEYTEVCKHLAAFEGISMQTRTHRFMDELKKRQWHVENFDGDIRAIEEVPTNFIAIEKDWESRCNDTGRLTASLSLAVRTPTLNEFVELAYQQGLLIHKIASKNDYYHLKVHPDNNVPGTLLSPPSIQVESEPT